MSVDKTIRIGVDSSGATQDMSRIRGQVDQANSSSIAGIKEQMRLLREKSNLEDEIARKRQKSRQDDINYAQKDLQLWQLQRDAESRGLTGAAKSRYDRNTRTESNERKQSLITDRMDLASMRTMSDDERSDRKKQIKRLEELQETVRGEGKKGREVQQTFLEKVLVSAGMGPNTAKGVVDNVIPGLGRIAAAYAVMAYGAKAEEGLRRYSTNMNQNVSKSVVGTAFSIADADVSTNVELGMSRKKFREDYYSRYQTAYGDKNLRGGEAEGVEMAGLERSRGLSGGQTESLLALSRYSGASSSGMASSFENYLTKTGQASVRLPEIMTTYLQVANSILSKTGAVDPIAIGRVIQSIGSSYGVQGLNLDRMSTGFQKMGDFSQNPIMLSLQQVALKKRYPNLSSWDKATKMQHFMEDPELMKLMVEQLQSFGGGGEASKWATRNFMGDSLSNEDINKLMKNNFKISNVKQSSENFFKNESKKQVGTFESLMASAADVKDVGGAAVVGAGSLVSSGILSNQQSELGKQIQAGITNALDGWWNRNKHQINK